MKRHSGQTFATALLAAAFFFTPSFTVAASPVTADLEEIDRAFPPKTIELTVPSNGKQMAGHAYLANGPGPHPTVVTLLGFPGNEKNLDLAQSLRRAGFNILYFHYRGAWGSEGEFGLHNASEDAAAAIAFLKKNAKEFRTDPKKISVFGSSFGGFTALSAAAADTSVQCTVATSPTHFSLLGEKNAAKKDGEKNSGLALGGDSVPGLKNYSVADLFTEIASDVEFANVTRRMAAFKGRPLMIVSGDKDGTTSHSSQLPLVAAGKKAGADPMTHVVFDGDHSFSWRRIEFSEVVVNWMSENCR
ncbi:MAG: alpha/beta fold hydrolase [Kordiimonadaceae bacterium]|nr:alpha/beta fold hydrolase [Kordiimonadaceae bacterium]